MQAFFSEKRIEDRFAMILSELEEDIKKLDLPDVVEIGRQKSTEAFYRRYSIGQIELDLPRMNLSEIKKIEIGRQEKNGRPIPIFKNHVILSIPFVGPESLFNYIPTHADGPVPMGNLEEGNVILNLPMEDASLQAKQMVEALVSYTELINSDAQNFNERLRETLEKKLEARREEIEKEREEYQRVEAFVQGYNKLRWA